MIAQVFVLSALVAVSMAGVIAAPAAVTYAAHPAPIAVASAPLTIAAAPAAVTYTAAAAPVAVAHAAPVAYAAAPAPVAVAHAAPVAIPAPVAYSTGVKIAHTYEPVEQHGYKIAY